ncbi:hypothetical protein HDE_05896 [Halotydeus destructor]|nr:hypothetical protein HDE_05896 [Halotydeus destructor]
MSVRNGRPADKVSQAANYGGGYSYGTRVYYYQPSYQTYNPYQQMYNPCCCNTAATAAAILVTTRATTVRPAPLRNDPNRDHFEP